MTAATYSKELGTLVAVVLKARNLPDKHTFTKQDPYAVLELGPCRVQTPIDKRGGQHPVWDEDLHVKVLEEDTKKNRIMKVSCYAKEPKGDDLIGSGEVDITDTLSSGEFDDWVKLQMNSSYRGEVYLEMTFFAAGPPPLVRRPSKLAPSERLWRPPQTSPKGSAQPSPYNSPPVHHAAELGPSHAASHLAPPRSSRSQSPTSRTEAPLPPIPDEIPASLLPAANRSSAVGMGGAGKAASTGTSPKTEPVGVPAALRPGGPGGLPRPTVGQHQHQQPQRQRVSSMPTSPTHAYQSPLPAGTVQSPFYGSQPMSSGFAPPPAQPVYSPPRNDYTASTPSQPAYLAPHQNAAAPNQPVYSASQPPPNQPVYPPPQPPISPANQPAYRPQSNYSPYRSVSPYPTASYPTNPSYDTPPLRYSTSTSPPPQAPSHPPMQFVFPEPNIPGPSYPPHSTSNHLTAYPNEAEEERQRRLSTRYGSPMPLPPGVTPPPPSKSPSSHTTRSPSPHPHPQLPPSASVPAPATAATANVSTTPPHSRVPDSYLKRERAALARAQQEEADAELARRLAAESELEESATSMSPSVSSWSKTTASRTQPTVESDEEIARRLARELNSDVLEGARRKSKDGGMPGGW